MNIKTFFVKRINLIVDKLKKNYDYNLAVVAIVKDEAPYIREWIEYPYFIQGKNRCLRIYLDKKNKLSSVYFINGVRATKEQAMMYCTKAAFPSNPKKSDVLDINVDNIISIK